MKILLLSLLLLNSCSSFDSSEHVTELTIFNTNDHHGHYLKDSKGRYGMSARKTLLNLERSKVKNHLLLSGGDINTGTIESDLFHAKPDFLGMKKLGYDAMAVGNHEFDNSYEVLKGQQKLAGFPFLAANIYWKGTQKRVFKAYIVKEIEGIKIGIFGLTTTDTPFKASNEDAKRKFDFREIVSESKKIVKVLQEKEKVDLIIATTHIGHDGSATAGGDKKVAYNVPGIDIIIGGHSQEIINAQIHANTIVVQAQEWGKYLGRLNLKIAKRKNGKAQIKMLDYTLIPVNLSNQNIKEDPKMLELFKPFEIKAKKLGNIVVGEIDKDLSGNRLKIRSGPMPIAQFIGEAIRSKVPSVDLPIVNGGSIRGSIKKGYVTRRDLHSVHPYGNSIATVQFSPEEFFSYVSSIYKFTEKTKFIIGGYPHFANTVITHDGLKLLSIADKSGRWSVRKENGKIISSKKTLTIGTLNFLARGGDDYPNIKGHKSYSDSGFMLNMALIEYFKIRKKIQADDYTP